MASATVKMKSINNNQSGSLSRGSAPIVKKKFESASKHQSVDNKNKSQPIKTVKSEEKGKTTTTTSTQKKKREKKVFSLPGQKYDPPEEIKASRAMVPAVISIIFLSSGQWLMEHGMLSPERAKKAYERKQRKQKLGKMGTPIKSPPTPSKPESSNRHKAASKNGDMKTKKRMADDSDEEIIRSPKMRRG
ncbi:hypothetical protein Cgig2_002169 [Carnegiea gigantea]|uniref:Uncharacterized protein n=1 Tax=Carnegiea gigantea TaxID=171969 RepID=A0A9Q1KVI7_9CARY|nr:hypothetical protein Cgig2_002169 [Carnegiea gigantea]